MLAWEFQLWGCGCITATPCTCFPVRPTDTVMQASGEQRHSLSQCFEKSRLISLLFLVSHLG